MQILVILREVRLKMLLNFNLNSKNLLKCLPDLCFQKVKFLLLIKRKENIIKTRAVALHFLFECIEFSCH